MVLFFILASWFFMRVTCGPTMRQVFSAHKYNAG